MMPFPTVPNYAVSERLGFALQVETVQVAQVACRVPPATFEGLGTLLRPQVVVPVFGGELHTNVAAQRVILEQTAQ